MSTNSTAAAAAAEAAIYAQAAAAVDLYLQLHQMLDVITIFYA